MTTTTTQPATTATTPSATAAATTDEQLKKLLFNRQARRISILQDEIRQRQDEIDGIKAAILDTHKPGSYRADGLKVTIKTGRKTLDARRFATAYPAAEHPGLYQLKPLPVSQLERKITEDGVRDYVTYAKPSVTVS